MFKHRSLTLIAVAQTILLLGLYSSDCHAQKPKRNPKFEGYIKNGKKLMSRSFSFNSREAAEAFMKSQPMIQGPHGPMKHSGPYDRTNLRKWVKKYHRLAPWSVSIYMYVDLIPKGHENEFSLPEDELYLDMGWGYARSAIGYPYDDGVVRQVERFEIKEHNFSRIKGQGTHYIRGIPESTDQAC